MAAIVVINVDVDVAVGHRNDDLENVCHRGRGHNDLNEGQLPFRQELVHSRLPQRGQLCRCEVILEEQSGKMKQKLLETQDGQK